MHAASHPKPHFSASCAGRVGALLVLLAVPFAGSAAQALGPRPDRAGFSGAAVINPVVADTTTCAGVTKSPVLAGILSYLLPGMGSLYAEHGAHGVRHLVIAAVSATAFIAPWVVPGLDNGAGVALFVAGIGTGMVNSIWSISTAVHDANAYNRRARGSP